MPTLPSHTAASLWSISSQALLALGLLLAVVSPQQSSAAVVVSNLGNTSYIASTALYDYWNNYRAISTAGSFTTGSSSSNLDSITLTLQGMYDPNFNQGGFTISLYSNGSNGLPGTDLGVVFTGSSSPFTAGLYDYAASNPYTLTASTTYWLVASIVPLSLPAPASGYEVLYTQDLAETGSGTASGWSINSSLAYIDSNSTTGDWQTIAGTALLFAVDASPVLVPESGSALLLICASGLLLRRRRK